MAQQQRALYTWPQEPRVSATQRALCRAGGPPPQGAGGAEPTESRLAEAPGRREAEGAVPGGPFPEAVEQTPRQAFDAVPPASGLGGRKILSSFLLLGQRQPWRRGWVWGGAAAWPVPPIPHPHTRPASVPVRSLGWAAGSGAPHLPWLSAQGHGGTWGNVCVPNSPPPTPPPAFLGRPTGKMELFLSPDLTLSGGSRLRGRVRVAVGSESAGSRGVTPGTWGPLQRGLQGRGH